MDACIEDTTKEGHKIIFRLTQDEDHIIFDIADNGIGMDRETRENMFTLFFSSKGARGTGLGLFVTHEIIQQHGGSIEVNSSQGQGSRFQLKIPKGIPQSVKITQNSKK
jgi:signal transduction histidine kinase